MIAAITANTARIGPRLLIRVLAPAVFAVATTPVEVVVVLASTPAALLTALAPAPAAAFTPVPRLLIPFLIFSPAFLKASAPASTVASPITFLARASLPTAPLALPSTPASEEPRISVRFSCLIPPTNQSDTISDIGLAIVCLYTSSWIEINILPIASLRTSKAVLFSSVPLMIASFMPISAEFTLLSIEDFRSARRPVSFFAASPASSAAFKRFSASSLDIPSSCANKATRLSKSARSASCFLPLKISSFLKFSSAAAFCASPRVVKLLVAPATAESTVLNIPCRRTSASVTTWPAGPVPTTLEPGIGALVNSASCALKPSASPSAPKEPAKAFILEFIAVTIV